MAKIFIIDDDIAMDMLCESLSYYGHDCSRIPSADAALKNIDKVVTADLIVLDIIMSWPTGRKRTSLAGNNTAGMEVFKEIRKRKESIPIIVYSGTMDGALIESIAKDKNASFFSKWSTPPIRELVQTIHSELGITSQPKKLQPFIVHGHDENAKLSLKNYLQNTLNLPEPIILHEQPNLGRTIIEKFEETATESSIIFVLLTPDDVIANPNDNDDIKHRARQNVIFEMGYFIGLLGRRSGRVIFLYKPPLELPSDLSGVAYIDISHGIDVAGEQIRREVDNAEN
jgi:predicted nucleotide-binding protein